MHMILVVHAHDTDTEPSHHEPKNHTLDNLNISPKGPNNCTLEDILREKAKLVEEQDISEDEDGQPNNEKGFIPVKGKKAIGPNKDAVGRITRSQNPKK